jgi:hypothetical protein
MTCPAASTPYWPSRKDRPGRGDVERKAQHRGDQQDRREGRKSSGLDPQRDHQDQHRKRQRKRQTEIDQEDRDRQEQDGEHHHDADGEGDIPAVGGFRFLGDVNRAKSEPPSRIRTHGSSLPDSIRSLRQALASARRCQPAQKPLWMRLNIDVGQTADLRADERCGDRDGQKNGDDLGNEGQGDFLNLRQAPGQARCRHRRTSQSGRPAPMSKDRPDRELDDVECIGFTHQLIVTPPDDNHLFAVSSTAMIPSSKTRTSSMAGDRRQGDVSVRPMIEPACCRWPIGSGHRACCWSGCPARHWRTSPAARRTGSSPSAPSGPGSSVPQPEASGTRIVVDICLGAFGGKRRCSCSLRW